MNFSTVERRPVVAGQFYPADPEELRSLVSFCRDAGGGAPAPAAPHSVCAVMVPHAGYVFSGAVAGATLAQVALTDTLVLLGPNHTGQGVPLSVWSGGAWRTPLGPMPIAEELRAALCRSGAGFSPDMAAHAREHSLEVLLPFIQLMQPTACCLPVTVSEPGFAALEKAGKTLGILMAQWARRGMRVTLVVSSDMSHYLPHDSAVKQDALALEAIQNADAKALYTTVRSRNISMCGVLPMTLALVACKECGVSRGLITTYATSGQTGKAHGATMDRVVGYAGALLPYDATSVSA